MTIANNATILRSEFYIGQASDDEIQECGSRASGYGIYMDNCTGFAIEENRFYKTEGAPTGYYAGIRIAETQATDEIYKNYFEGLSYANYTEGKNWFDININQGLAFFCNENTDNFADFYVVQNENNIGGIQSNQGNDDNVTGNKFSTSDATWHFYNDGNHLIEYYYCNSCPDETPDEDNIFNLQPEGINSAN